MFIWGSKGVVADLGPQETRACPTCEKDRSFKLMLQYKVHHIWYLFQWVTSKQYAVVCDVCQRGEKLATKAVEARLPKSPIPFLARWGWAFLVALIVGIGVVGAIGDSNNKDRTQAYLAAPQKSDVYVVNVSSLLKSPDSSRMYGLLRVRGVQGDRVEFDVPIVTYNKVTGATKDLRNGRAADPAYFSGTPIVLAREELARLQDSGALHSIERE